MAAISKTKHDKKTGQFTKNDSGRTNVPITPTASPISATRATAAQGGSSVADALSLWNSSKHATPAVQTLTPTPARNLVASLTELEIYTDRFHEELEDLEDDITSAKTSLRESERAQLPILEARRQKIYVSLVLALDDIAAAAAMIDDDPFATHTNRVVISNESLAWSVRALAEKIEITEASGGDQAPSGTHQRAINHAQAALARVRAAANGQS